MRAIDSKNFVQSTTVIAFILVFGFILIAARRAVPQTTATTASSIVNLR